MFEEGLAQGGDSWFLLPAQFAPPIPHHPAPTPSSRKSISSSTNQNSVSQPSRVPCAACRERCLASSGMIASFCIQSKSFQIHDVFDVAELVHDNMKAQFKPIFARQDL